VIGRFQKNAKISLDELKYILQTKSYLANIPIIANADFGHTNPMFTFPIGGKARLEANEEGIRLTIVSH
jgi:muramoyltetrapeptide carboxypeptidase LdcA involved in peptidoglycan recycling